MKRKGLAELSGITIEGGALSTSVLQSLMARRLEHSDPASYHIEEGYTTGEKIAEDWNRTRSAWKAFTKEKERLGTEPGAGATRDKFLLPLFERLGYGRLPYGGGIEAEGERYAISHRWGDVPIHLVGADTDLDSRTGGVAGAAKRSPHGLVLEYLNRGTANPWGFVSNGRRLRLLRENRSIVRQSYIEFDLEGIIEGESYADFTALWLLCHESRLEGKGEAHILEGWREAGIKEGERALDELRTGMEKAISSLGTGLIAHPANTALRETLRKGGARGGLDTEVFYHELLRLAYRLIFLFVAEDRDVLLDPAAPAEAKRRYREHYSSRRLRGLAMNIRGGGHGDLWRGLVTVMDLLADKGCPDLALPALGSFLWERESIEHLAACEIANRDLLGAVRELAFTLRGGALWPTDFRNLGSEELGSVYESLLELHTELNLEGGVFRLATAPGHERKTSGSYYTPTSLVERLLDDALDPVIARAARDREPEAALLALKVCDPAMGSGHFLTGAARRIAKALAAVRTGDPEPGPEPLRHAMADVVQNCVYGVDLNPLAVELCKISLWMEALEPGRPLSFLDHHLKCGNSLIGATRELMRKGIPEGAFSALTGDDKKTVAAAKKRNAEELGGAKGLFDEDDQFFQDYGKIADRFTKLGGLDETTLEGVRLLASRYRGLVEAPEYLAELSAANGWCAAFFQPKRPGAPEPITQGRFRAWLRDPTAVPKPIRDLAEGLAERVRFFHWELAFPEVFRPADGRDGGFDAVLGNPPWERIKLQETEWFAERNTAIAGAPNADARKKMIAGLEKDGDTLFAAYQDALHDSEAMSSYIRRGGRYPLCGRGDVNLYSVFTELARSLLAPGGRLGIIVPSGIATDDTTKDFFADLVQKRVLVSLYDFENHGIFPAVHNSYKFCLLTLAGSPLAEGNPSRFVFFAHSVADLEEPERLIELTDRDFLRMNPNTKTAPIFRSRRDADITRKVYERVPVLIREGPPEENPWGASFMRMFDMTNDSGLFRNSLDLEADRYTRGKLTYAKGTKIYVPLYEAKMADFYDHRVADVVTVQENATRKQQPREISVVEKSDTGREAIPFFWIAKSEVNARLSGVWTNQWLMGWRNVTSPTNYRSLIPILVPISGVGNSANVLFTKSEMQFCLYSNLAAYVLDYVVRVKLGGVNINHFYVKQFPILPPAAYLVPCPWEPGAGTITDWIRPRVLELVYTSHSLEPFARDLGYTGPPFAWNVVRRFQIRCELDAAFFLLYGINRDDADYIMDTFTIVKKHDEAEFGEYRTKRVILERYDEYAEAMRRNTPGDSRLAGEEGPVPARDFPALPMPVTIAELIGYLARLGVEVENNRPLGGGLWVYRGRAGFGALAEHLQKSGVDVKYYPEGRKKRAGEQYEIDPGKRLG
jgi:hypothetical protein